MSRTFAAASISAYMLFSALSIFTVTDIQNKTAKHLRQKFSNEVAALYIACAYVAHIKVTAQSARRIVSARIHTMSLAVLKVSASPIITDH